MTPWQSSRGFYVLMIAATLVGVSALALVPVVLNKQSRAAQDSERQALEKAKTAIITYAQQNGRFPAPVPDPTGRCRQGTMPNNLGVSNHGPGGQSHPFCLDVNNNPAANLLDGLQLKDVCSKGRAMLDYMPYVCTQTTGACTSAGTCACAGRAAAAFVLYSTGSDKKANLRNAATYGDGAANATRVYESEGRGMQASPDGDGYYDDLVLSHPLTALSNSCATLDVGSAPVCTLRSTANSVTQGIPVSLTAAVSNIPSTSIHWSVSPATMAPLGVPTVKPTGVGGLVALTTNACASTTYTYTASGSNAYGSCTSTPVAVTVSPVNAARCVLTASPATIVRGQSTILTAGSCTAQPTSYVWSPATGRDGFPTAVVTPNLSTTYTVTTSYTGGCSHTASAAVTVTPAVVGTVLVGGSVSSSIPYRGYRERWQLNITSPQNIRILLDGLTLSDAYLRVYSQTGSFIAENDDGGGNLDSLIILSFLPGTYFLEAAAFADNYTGTFQLSVTGQ